MASPNTSEIDNIKQLAYLRTRSEICPTKPNNMRSVSNESNILAGNQNSNYSNLSTNQLLQILLTEMKAQTLEIKAQSADIKNQLELKTDKLQKGIEKINAHFKQEQTIPAQKTNPIETEQTNLNSSIKTIQLKIEPQINLNKIKLQISNPQTKIQNSNSTLKKAKYFSFKKPLQKISLIYNKMLKSLNENYPKNPPLPTKLNSKIQPIRINLLPPSTTLHHMPISISNQIRTATYQNPNTLKLVLIPLVPIPRESSRLN